MFKSKSSFLRHASIGTNKKSNERSSPETMPCMGEQFGLEFSREDVVKTQNAMASLSLGDLDKLMNW